MKRSKNNLSERKCLKYILGNFIEQNEQKIFLNNELEKFKKNGKFDPDIKIEFLKKTPEIEKGKI